MCLYNIDCQINGRSYIVHNKNKEYIVYEAISIFFTTWPSLLDCLEYSTPTLNAYYLFNAGLDYMNMLLEQSNYYLRGRFSCSYLKVTSLYKLEKRFQRMNTPSQTFQKSITILFQS